MLTGNDAYYTAGLVGIGTQTPKATLEVKGDFIRTITRAMGQSSNDGRDTGYVTGRTLNFTKRHTDTGIRFTWTDNLRAYHPGGGANACRWTVRYDSAACPAGDIHYGPYSSLSSDNTHIPGSRVSTCFGLAAGDHNVKIYVETESGYASTDCYTGWHSNWQMEVEELR